MGSPTISRDKILEAAKGNPALIELLSQMAQTTAVQQAVTGTTPAAGPTQNSSAPTPQQATGYVSVVAGIYTVQLVNPGASSPLSQLQAAAAGQNITPLQPVTTIFHQVRASTSPAFNVNSNTQTFGGNTGSAQNLWTLSGLGSGTWYFQFRSSFDGINFNTWKNANSGAGLGGLVNQVTTETAAFSEWALFSLPGSEIMGVVEGLLSDQEIMGIPAGFNLYSSGLLAIAGPNGYSKIGDSAYGVTHCDVDLVIPTGGGVTSGVPDYPVKIQMQYGQAHAAPNYWPGIASVFGIAFNPLGSNVKLYPGTSGANWVVFTLPGGCRIAVGQGKNFDGESIWVPPSVTWIDPSRMMSICSFTEATDTGLTPHGYFVNQLSGLTLNAQYKDGSTAWSTTAHWFAIAWQDGAHIITAGGNNFLEISLQGGHSFIFGAGQIASGTPITLPAGYNSTDMLSICTPGGFNEAGHHFQGIAQCSFLGLTPYLWYEDDSFNEWDGAVNWMLGAWR
jgi:hypothetical protein